MKRFTIAVIMAAALATRVQGGTPVQVEINGFVEFNQINDPPLANVSNSADATVSFLLDTDLFADGAMFPTRGYQIANTSFELAIDAESLGLQVPFPAGQRPYFILRDNDPAVGGFFLDVNPDAGFPAGLTVFNFTIDDGPFNAMGLIFEQMTITAISSCPWDCGDRDGIVDINDFLDLLANWGPCP